MWIIRLLNALWLAEFASKKEDNCNYVPGLNTSLITKLCFVNCHIIHIRSDDINKHLLEDYSILLRSALSSILQIYYYQTFKIIGSISFWLVGLGFS